MDQSPSNVRYFTGAQQIIVNLPRSYLINAFLRKDRCFSPSCGTEPGLSIWAEPARAPRGTPFPGLPALPYRPGHSGQSPHGEELQLHHESWRICAPTVLVSILAVGVGCWLKGHPGILALAEGGERDVQGKPETESCEVSDLCDPKDPGSRSPREQFTWGHSAVSPPVRAEPAEGLLQNPLGGPCSLWPLSAALGTWAGCKCVRAGGMEDAVAEKGVF